MHIDIIANSQNTIDLNTRKILRLSQYVVAVDGALDTLLKYNIVPHSFMGDFDSASSSAMQLARDLGVKFVHLPDQQNTDFVKSIEHYSKHYKQNMTKNITNVHCYNVLGGLRLDHTTENLRALKRMYTRILPITLFTLMEKIQYVQDAVVEVQGQSGDHLSIISFDEARITSQGLQYDMTHYDISSSRRDSVCNQLRIETAKITIQGCALLITTRNCDVQNQNAGQA
jgi:thiamine pyrophosphokinase